jgi:glycerophosphoryl diester phosphodiesterase
LEGTVAGDPAGSLRIYKFDVATQKYEGLVGFYKLENPANAIGDMTVINENEYLVIERDNGQGADAKFKKIYKVDFSRKDANGNVAKQEIADLLNIADPLDLNKDGLTTYRMPFVTIEDVLVIDEKTILVANDNNYPFSLGRPPAIDNNEIVWLTLEQPLLLDPRVGLKGLEFHKDTTVRTQGNADQTVFTGDGNDNIFTGKGDDKIAASQGNNYIVDQGGNNTITTGDGNDTIETGAGDDIIKTYGGDDIITAGRGRNLIDPGTGNDWVYLDGGVDTVVLNRGVGSVTVSKFSINDRLSLGSGLQFSDLAFQKNDGDTLISAGTDLLATLRNFNGPLSQVTFV